MAQARSGYISPRGTGSKVRYQLSVVVRGRSVWVIIFDFRLFNKHQQFYLKELAADGEEKQ